MFLPIGDTPNPKGTPWVNYALMLANMLVFGLYTLPLMGMAVDPTDPALNLLLKDLFASYPEYSRDELILIATQEMKISAYDTFLMRWGYLSGAPSLVTLFSSMFLHGGWMHLLGNMLFLWIYGDNVEHRLGRVGYLIGYLLAGAMAALLYGLFAPEGAGNTPMVGASGAISGVLGFYFIWFPRNQVRMLVVIFIYIDVWHINARIVLGFYLLIENLLPFLLTDQSGGGVAYGAHLGGFAAGLLGALGLNAWNNYRCSRKADGCVEPAARAGTDLPEGAPEDVQRLLSEQRPGDALTLFMALSPVQRQQVPVPTGATLAQWLAASGNPDAALAIYGRLRADHPRGPHLDLVLLGLGLTLLHQKGRPTAAYQYLLDTLDADPSPETAAAARAALEEINRLQKFPVNPRGKNS